MRILALSDKVVPLLYGPSLRQVVGPIDLVLGCGDLPLYYIDYIASTLEVPCYLVQGNHASGAEFMIEPGEDHAEPGHLMNLDGRLVCEQGLLVAGLEGSIRYNQNPRFQYNQSEMWLKAWGLAPGMLWNRLRHGRFLDILVTHNPPAGIHDGPDRAHQGFKSFLWLMRTFRPRFLIHGHKHVYRHDEITETTYHETQVINVYPYRVLET